MDIDRALYFVRDNVALLNSDAFYKFRGNLSAMSEWEKSVRRLSFRHMVPNENSSSSYAIIARATSSKTITFVGS